MAETQEPDWLTRFRAAVERDGRSLSKISRSAGLGQNYLQQMFAEGKEPQITTLLALCKELNVSVVYILFGAEIDSGADELIGIYSELNKAERKALVDLSRVFQARSVQK